MLGLFGFDPRARAPIALGFALSALCACDGSPSPSSSSSPPASVFSDADAGATGKGAKPAQGSRAQGSSEGKGEDQGRKRPSDEDAGTSRPDGSSCTRDLDCESLHCSNDICCANGECCFDVADCPAGGGIALVCEHPARCEGMRGPAACIDSRCSVVDGVPDDSACDQHVVADECGPFASVYCNGQAEQRTPRCHDTCTADSDCDRSAHCDSTCIADVPKGGACDENSDCESGQCNGGRCCVAGNCTRDPAGEPGDAKAQCLDTLARDACSRCGCMACTESMLGCYDSGDPARDGLCSGLLECALRQSCFAACVPGRGCFRDSCWCGPDCTTPAASCTRPIEAAAGGANSKATLAERALDPARALYHAERYGECLNEKCARECGL